MIQRRNVNIGECLRTLKSDRSYKGMKVEGVKGLIVVTI